MKRNLSNQSLISTTLILDGSLSSGLLHIQEGNIHRGAASTNGKTPSKSGSGTSELGSKVMIVDDEKNITSLFSSILTGAGYQVKHIANNGVEAVETIKKDQDIDLIIMDQKMPKMDGLEASDRIREIKPDVKIIMISAYEIPRENRGAFAAILEKPISKKQLLDCVRSA